MGNEILFTERQKFRQWWLSLILFGTNGMFLFGVFKQVIGGERFGNNPMSDTGLLVAAGLILLLTFIFFNCRLDTIIKSDGIYVRFFPFHFKFKHYAWDTVTKSFIRHYSALSEYGGWGLRLGLSGKGTAYNISGNQGLQLEFTNNRKLLIGTNKPDELASALDKIGQLNS